MRLPTLILSGALLMTLFLSACGDDDEDVDQSADDAPSDTVQLVAADFEFAPTELSFTSGEETQITFTNTGQAQHSFTIDELDVSQDVDANGEVTFDFTAPDHNVEFYCRFHPDQMQGTITIGGSSAPVSGSGSPGSTDDDGRDGDNSGPGGGDDDDSGDDDRGGGSNY